MHSTAAALLVLLVATSYAANAAARAELSAARTVLDSADAPTLWQSALRQMLTATPQVQKCAAVFFPHRL